MNVSKPNRIGLVNLGCPKNTVDSEGILGTLALAGFSFTEDPMDADICIVNTCGFLDAARREAAEVLRELAARRGLRGRPLLVATGCLVERVGGAPELRAFLEAADARVGFQDYPRLPQLCLSLLDGKTAESDASGYRDRDLPRAYVEWLNQPRMRIGEAGSAYLKLGEGCSNGCAYCSIPLIRGRRISRPMEAILREARQLVDAGARELNLIAQDTTAYGVDLDGKPRMAALLRRLLEMPDDIWFRILYAHPRHLDDDVLAVMASDPRVCPYLDLPLQHVHDGMLRAMGRGYNRRRVDMVLERLHHHVPDAALRTTFIVGHPGEDEAAFEDLLAFVEQGHADHAGVFVWSPEPGTASEGLPGRIPADVAEERRDRLMRAQAQVSAARAKSRHGVVTDMLLERRVRRQWVGRTPWQAPEVDGVTVLKRTSRRLHPGDRLRVDITGSGTYDLEAREVRA